MYSISGFFGWLFLVIKKLDDPIPYGAGKCSRLTELLVYKVVNLTK